MTQLFPWTEIGPTVSVNATHHAQVGTRPLGGPRGGSKGDSRSRRRSWLVLLFSSSAWFTAVFLVDGRPEGVAGNFPLRGAALFGRCGFRGSSKGYMVWSPPDHLTPLRCGAEERL